MGRTSARAVLDVAGNASGLSDNVSQLTTEEELCAVVQDDGESGTLVQLAIDSRNRDGKSVATNGLRSRGGGEREGDEERHEHLT